MSDAWTALAIGAVIGSLTAVVALATQHWVRKTIASRVCPLCGCGCRATMPPARSIGDGAQQLIDQLDRQKGKQ